MRMGAYLKRKGKKIYRFLINIHRTDLVRGNGLPAGDDCRVGDLCDLPGNFFFAAFCSESDHVAHIIDYVL